MERLAQRGLLKVVCGTDTLGVGVNIPIRTVLFSKLCKFDGEKVAILRVREFRQIAGRAGRKGFDVRGSVVAQAPEHVILNRREAARPGAKKNAPKKKPPRGFVPWSRDTFDKLIASPPETLVSVFDVDHGALVHLLQRPEASGPRGEGWRAVAELIALSHETPASKARLRRRAAQLVRSLRHAGIAEVARDARGRPALRVKESLQIDFSLFATLSLYLVEAAQALDHESPSYALEVISLVEAVLENPMPILLAQRDRARDELIAQLKAEGVPYEDRIRRLESVSWPQPEAEFIGATFRVFAENHPWVGESDLHPKGVAREMFESCQGFVDRVRELGVGRSEGTLLRYLSQVYDTLVRSLPDADKTDAVHDAIAYFRTLIQGVDASLLQAWQALRAPVAGAGPAARRLRPSIWPRTRERCWRARAPSCTAWCARSLTKTGRRRRPACASTPTIPGTRIASSRRSRRSSRSTASSTSRPPPGSPIARASPRTARAAGRWLRCWSTRLATSSGRCTGRSISRARRTRKGRWSGSCASDPERPIRAGSGYTPRLAEVSRCARAFSPSSRRWRSCAPARAAGIKVGSKPGASDADYDRERRECLQSSAQGRGAGQFGYDQPDQRLFESCMQQRGWQRDSSK